MPANYQVVVQNTTGVPVDTFDRFIDLSYARRFNTMGSLILTIPDIITPGYINRDFRLLVYRSVDDRPPYLDMDAFWLVRKITYNSDDRTWTIRADDPLSILKRRIVGYKEGTEYANKNSDVHIGTTFYADDLIKEFVRENLGSDTFVPVTGPSPDPDRDLSDYLVIDVDRTEGPAMEKDAAFQNILSVCQDIAKTSAQLGINLYFDIIVRPDGSLFFKTWTSIRGSDRGASSASPLIFYPDHNLEKLTLEWDYSEEISFIYAGGEDSGEYRLIVRDGDSDRAAVSPWNRNEKFLDLRDTGNISVMDDEIDAALYGGRGRLRIVGSPIEVSGTQYGVDYLYGDVVQATVMGYSFDSTIDSVSVRVADSGEEISVQLSGEFIL